MTWKAYSDRVVVKVDERPKQTASGIVIPDKVKGGKIGLGYILAKGPQAQGVQVGDRVSFQTSGAHEVEEGVVSLNVDYILAAQRDE